MHAEGLVHHGVTLSFDGDRQRINFSALVGKQVMVYGQTEVTRDLMELRQGQTIYEAEDVELHDFDGAPWVSLSQGRRTRTGSIATISRGATAITA